MRQKRGRSTVRLTCAAHVVPFRCDALNVHLFTKVEVRRCDQRLPCFGNYTKLPKATEKCRKLFREVRENVNDRTSLIMYRRIHFKRRAGTVVYKSTEIQNVLFSV